jgi:hypothetical protein
MSFGRSLELYFVDGNPDGMLTAEVFNWTGHVLRIPRTRLTEGLKRAHAHHTGVYLLLGADDNGELAYIGEAEDMSERLKQHAKQKDWWEQAVLITTTGDALHKAHVKYLESRLVEKALKADNVRLENGNAPARASLNEAAQANMESFLDTLNMVLPAIRIDLLQTGRVSKATAKQPARSSEEKVVFHFALQKHRVQATAELIANEMIVKAGSRIRSDWIGDRAEKTHYWKLYDQLVEQQIIQVSENGTVLSEDYAFSSPSAAASIVSGRSANGRRDWKLEDGRTYAEWEIDALKEDS